MPSNPDLLQRLQFSQQGGSRFGTSFRANLPEDAPDAPYKQAVGVLHLHPDGEIGYLIVHEDFQRQGVATELMQRARAAGVEVKHSAVRSVAGDAWAHSVGGEIPPLNQKEQDAYESSKRSLS